jgi:hypothetical protein
VRPLLSGCLRRTPAGTMPVIRDAGLAFAQERAAGHNMHRPLPARGARRQAYADLTAGVRSGGLARISGGGGAGDGNRGPTGASNSERGLRAACARGRGGGACAGWAPPCRLRPHRWLDPAAGEATEERFAPAPPQLPDGAGGAWRRGARGVWLGVERGGVCEQGEHRGSRERVRAGKRRGRKLGRSACEVCGTHPAIRDVSGHSVT